MPDKAAWRKTLRAQRSALTAEEVLARSRNVQMHILASPEWAAAPSVGLYAAVRNEADTALLADAAWETGKDVFFPRIVRNAPGIMHFEPCLNRESMVKGPLGIPEPASTTSMTSMEENPRNTERWVPALIIVPGLAFDREGHRLGAGAGYYDRLFSKKSMQDSIRIGFAYAFQLVDALPAEAWDAPMHALATEEGLTWL